ncbi:MAG TPA: hypothetical protein VD763_01980, partial [Candidatus Saccharimonadales bacterium]|nr:hypothetical protein [Candidatus Saccharimonadales bacterium]
EHAIPTGEFDAQMPHEFWREVVDRVAAEAPDTLLLAEAFWMLEGYFVRTLGMHRVYNSAFMHMLRDEDGASFRKLIKDTLDYDPEILKRYVNFMSNPDEETAVEQFGKGDKYIGVATVMATLPGLPMLGHGQVEGFGEKYGMEFRRATLDEQPDPWLLQRHEREVFPLLHRRAWFADAHDFLLFDFVTDGGAVDEDVFAFSNGTGPTRSLVLYHNRFADSAGTIRDSAPYARKNASGAKRLVRRSLAEGLGLPNDPAMFVTFRDARTGLEYVRSSRDLWERGLHVRLGAYQGHVFWEFREVRDGSAGQWRHLTDRLAGDGVASLEDAMRELQLEPVHAPLRAVFDGPAVGRVLDGRADATDLATLERRFAAFLAAVAEATRVEGDPAVAATDVRERTGRGFAAAAGELVRADRAALLGWLALSRMGALASGADVAATSTAWFDELRLAPVLAGGFRRAGLGEAEAWAAADLVRVLLALPRPSGTRSRGRRGDARLLDRWLALEPVRTAMGVNTWQGETFLDRDRFETLLRWATRLDSIDGAAPADEAVVTRLLDAAAAADYQVEALRASLHAPAARKPTRATRTATPRRGS